MNGLFYNDKIVELNEYILFLKEVSVDVIVFGDFVVLMVVCEIVSEMKMYWSIEIMGINWYLCNYWGCKGVKCVVFVCELSMDSIIDIKEKVEVEIEV